MLLTAYIASTWLSISDRFSLALSFDHFLTFRLTLFVDSFVDELFCLREVGAGACDARFLVAMTRRRGKFASVTAWRLYDLTTSKLDLL